LPRTLISRAPQVHVTAAAVIGAVTDRGPLRHPDARRQQHREDRRVTTVLERPATAARAQLRKFNAAGKGTGLSVTFGGRSFAIGLGRSSSTASHRKNCPRERYC